MMTVMTIMMDNDIIMMMPLQPVMKNNSINQSASFKKVMYSVMGETEF